MGSFHGLHDHPVSRERPGGHAREDARRHAETAAAQARVNQAPKPSPRYDRRGEGEAELTDQGEAPEPGEVIGVPLGHGASPAAIGMGAKPA